MYGNLKSVKLFKINIICREHVHTHQRQLKITPLIVKILTQLKKYI